MVIIFIVWTLIYTIFYSLYILNKKIDEKELIDRIITGYSHMWYLILTIGLYIMVPIFKRIITTKKATRYFLIVIFIFFSCIPQITNIMLQIIYDFISNIIYQFVTSPNFSIFTFFTFQNDFMIYSGYFVMGYYLNRIQIKKNKRMIIYILGLLSGIITIICTILVSMEKQQETFYHFFNVNVALQAIAVFAFAKYNFKSNKIIKNIAKCTLWVYLIHMMIIYLLDIKLKINVLTYSPMISIPIMTFTVFLGSFIITNILNKIPIAKKCII